MMLTVSMTVCHLYQNLKNIKSVRSLKQASEGVNYCDKRAKSLCRWPLPPGLGGGDHLCSYRRKLIGSLVPVHSRSVWCNTYAFLDPLLKLLAFLLNYFTCFPIQNMIVLTDVVCYGWFMEWLCTFIAIINTFRSLFKASDTFNVFQVLIKMADSHRNCQHH